MEVRCLWSLCPLVAVTGGHVMAQSWAFQTGCGSEERVGERGGALDFRFCFGSLSSSPAHCPSRGEHGGIGKQ